MLAATACAAVLLASAGGEHPGGGEGLDYCGCDDFCAGKCAMAGGGVRENRTVYRVTPYNVSGLADKDTGDAAGDLFFRLGDELWLRAFCKLHPELHYERCEGGSWRDAGLLEHNVYASFVIETDGGYGPYSQCNPVPQPRGAPPAHPTRWNCDPNFCAPCPRVDSAVGFYNLSELSWGPPALPAPFAMWKYNANVLLGQGGSCSWYSTPASGECPAGQRPGQQQQQQQQQKPCHWRVVETGKVVNASCLDGLVGGAVEHSSDVSRACFAGCRETAERQRLGGAKFVRGPTVAESHRGDTAAGHIADSPASDADAGSGALAPLLRSTVPPAFWDECELNCFYTALFGGKCSSQTWASFS
jgi:hypothetical protein